jgi:two-component system sensor histidine kinase YesM
VTVRGAAIGDDLALTVEDDGVGMNADTLAAVRARLLEELPRDGRSIGMVNVHQRIRLHCGLDYGLSVESTPGEGTRVTIRVPRLAPARGHQDALGQPRPDGGQPRSRPLSGVANERA